MTFVGTALGHHTLPSATFACNGTVTWHVDTWTEDNSNDQALASDVEVWYSLDGGSFVKIGDFAFTAGNYLAGIGGTFNAGDATTVVIKAQLAPDTSWGDGDTSSPGPWTSDTVHRSADGCQPTPTPPTPTPTPTHTATATPTGEGPDVNLLNPICDGNVPWLTYNVTGAGEGDEVSITWVHPGGENVVQDDLPLSGKVLWPGAVVDSHGNPIDWPGWTFTGGKWVEGDDGFEWVRPTVQVIVSVDSGSVSTTGHTANVMVRLGANVVAAAPVDTKLTVAYPPSSPNCNANPPGGGVEAATGKPKVTPPSTSTAVVQNQPASDGWQIVVLGLVVLLTSILIVTPRERRRVRNR